MSMHITFVCYWKNNVFESIFRQFSFSHKDMMFGHDFGACKLESETEVCFCYPTFTLAGIGHGDRAWDVTTTKSRREKDKVSFYSNFGVSVDDVFLSSDYPRQTLSSSNVHLLRKYTSFDVLHRSFVRLFRGILLGFYCGYSIS
jgi:hypothetical protein